MAVFYSKDLRERVMAYIDGGGLRQDACRIFQISEKTLYNWKNLRKKSGDLSPLKTGSKGHRKFSYEALAKYVETVPDQTLHEMGEVFNVSYRTIDYALTKLGITRKKNYPIFREKRKRA
jgi:transposase